jgi:hypothetical protein
LAPDFENRDHSDPRIPRCRYVILCLDGRLSNLDDRIEIIESDGTRYEIDDTTGDRFLLWSPVFMLTPDPGRNYPALIEQLYLFAQLSNGSGEHRLAIEALRLRGGESFRLFLEHFAFPSSAASLGRV